MRSKSRNNLKLSTYFFPFTYKVIPLFSLLNDDFKADGVRIFPLWINNSADTLSFGGNCLLLPVFFKEDAQ